MSIFLYQLTDLHRRIYYAPTHPHPYLTEMKTSDTFPDTAFARFWEGQTTPAKAEWVEVRVAVLERDEHRCTQCGSVNNLHVHHYQARRHGGTNQMDNLQTLCECCHASTPTWGRPRGTGRTQYWRAG
jgi:5-methylcytosine-specific restriction endonuclease McrA